MILIKGFSTAALNGYKCTSIASAHTLYDNDSR